MVATGRKERTIGSQANHAFTKDRHSQWMGPVRLVHSVAGAPGLRYRRLGKQRARIDVTNLTTIILDKLVNFTILPNIGDARGRSFH